MGVLLTTALPPGVFAIGALTGAFGFAVLGFLTTEPTARLFDDFDFDTVPPAAFGFEAVDTTVLVAPDEVVTPDTVELAFLAVVAALPSDRFACTVTGLLALVEAV